MVCREVGTTDQYTIYSVERVFLRVAGRTGELGGTPGRSVSPYMEVFGAVHRHPQFFHQTRLLMCVAP